MRFGDGTQPFAEELRPSLASLLFVYSQFSTNYREQTEQIQTAD